MLKIPCETQKREEIMKKIYFTSMEKRIMQYRLEQITRLKMADLEHVSVSAIDRKISEIADKIRKVI